MLKHQQPKLDLEVFSYGLKIEEKAAKVSNCQFLKLIKAFSEITINSVCVEPKVKNDSEL